MENGVYPEVSKPAIVIECVKSCDCVLKFQVELRSIRRIHNQIPWIVYFQYRSGYCYWKLGCKGKPSSDFVDFLSEAIMLITSWGICLLRIVSLFSQDSTILEEKVFVELIG
ncbi:hypothetical protein WA026_015480 [Henosepilachna vigintioctopunctata]|uniref:Uncharacterized protein n=1 Tax=Henosepilachna vigintioctopunctata TaxID=420089 RepID=A0AAW1UJF4_9CUCU